MEESRRISVDVNGIAFERDVSVRTSLADFLRHELMLTGTHVGCEHGVCGACTVLVERQVRAFLSDAGRAGGRGECDDHRRHRAVADRRCILCSRRSATQHGLQCGFCTPGMVTTLIEFLRDCPNPTEDEVRVAISGNLCRCTGYQGIVDAVLRVAGTQS